MRLEEKCAQCDKDVSAYLRPYLGRGEAEKMYDYIQHGNVSTFEHCRRVAEYSLYLARKWRWKVDEKSLVVGAFLHDFYLYDWHSRKRKGRLHGLCHPALAAKNARERFGVSDKVYYIIRTHMFPLTPTWVPRSKEGVLVCLADKYCAAYETIQRKRGRKDERDGIDGNSPRKQSEAEKK